jgi:hypothetical protein
MATDYYVDTNCANNGDGSWDVSGSGCDDEPDGAGAWNDLFNVIEAATYTAGDKIWIRRTAGFDEGVANKNADMDTADDGTPASPLYFIGWPRAADAITSADFTNGSTSVVNDDNDGDREQHQGRYITGPDGYDYLITDVAAGTFTIDRPYAGDTALNQAVNVKADEDYSSRPAAAQATWDGDAHDLPPIDFNNEAYQLVIRDDDYLVFKNIDFKDSSDAVGIVQLRSAEATTFQGCLFLQSSSNAPVIYINSLQEWMDLDRVIFEGSSVGGSQRGINAAGQMRGRITNAAFYNFGDTGLHVGSGSVYAGLYLENVNFGVELANDDDDIYMGSYSQIVGRDVKLGGTNGDVDMATTAERQSVTFANSQKVLGDWKFWYVGGTAEQTAVTGATPNKKLSDNVIEITPDTAATHDFDVLGWMNKVYESRKTYDAGTYNIKVWIYNDTGNTLNDTTFSDDILLRCRAEAGEYGDATTEYVSMPWTYSDEIDILDAADANDWDFLQADQVMHKQITFS